MNHSKPHYTIINSMVMETRDRIKLDNLIYFPIDKTKQYPCILIRTPFKYEWSHSDGEYFSQRGYIVVVQHIRGRFKSEGEYRFFINDASDGYDAVNFCAKLEMCNKQVFCLGRSIYAGTILQILKNKPLPRPLKGMILISAPCDFHTSSIMQPGGILESGFLLPFLFWLYHNQYERITSEEHRKQKSCWQTISQWVVDPWFRPYLETWTNWVSEYPTLPYLFELDKTWFAHHITKDWAAVFRKLGFPGAAEIFDSKTSTTLIKSLGLGSLKHVRIPILLITGKLDGFLKSTCNIYSRLMSNAKARNQLSNEKCTLVIGPWDHQSLVSLPNKTFSKIGDYEAGQKSRIHLQWYIQTWLSYQQGLDPPNCSVNLTLASRLVFSHKDPPVVFYQNSSSSWNTGWSRLYDFEPVSFKGHFVRNQTWFFSGPQMSSVIPITYGHLTREYPEVKTTTSETKYVYDPGNPTPSFGGTGISTPWMSYSSGIFNLSNWLKRPDVVSFQSHKLDKPQTVIGCPMVNVYIHSGAATTDLVVILIDKNPDGSIINISDAAQRIYFTDEVDAEDIGIVFDIDLNKKQQKQKQKRRSKNPIASSSRSKSKMSTRKQRKSVSVSTPTPRTMLREDISHVKSYKQCLIQFPPIFHTFEIGHSLGVAFCSGAFPRYSINSGTVGGDISSMVILKQENRILHTAPAVSFLTVPVIQQEPILWVDWISDWKLLVANFATAMKTLANAFRVFTMNSICIDLTVPHYSIMMLVCVFDSMDIPLQFIGPKEHIQMASLLLEKDTQISGENDEIDAIVTILSSSATYTHPRRRQTFQKLSIHPFVKSQGFSICAENPLRQIAIAMKKGMCFAHCTLDNQLLKFPELPVPCVQPGQLDESYFKIEFQEIIYAVKMPISTSKTPHSKTPMVRQTLSPSPVPTSYHHR